MAAASVMTNIIANAGSLGLPDGIGAVAAGATAMGLTPVTDRVKAVMESPEMFNYDALDAGAEEATDGPQRDHLSENSLQGKQEPLRAVADGDVGENAKAPTVGSEHIPKLVRPYIASGEDVGLMANLAASQERIIRALHVGGLLKDEGSQGIQPMVQSGVEPVASAAGTLQSYSKSSSIGRMPKPQVSQVTCLESFASHNLSSPHQVSQSPTQHMSSGHVGTPSGDAQSGPTSCAPRDKPTSAPVTPSPNLDHMTTTSELNAQQQLQSQGAASVITSSAALVTPQQH